MSLHNDLETLIRTSVYNITSSETEADMQYHYGKAMAYSGLLCTHSRRYIDYIQFIKEIGENVKFRRARGFSQPQQMSKPA